MSTTAMPVVPPYFQIPMSAAPTAGPTSPAALPADEPMPTPKLRLRIDDLAEAGSSVFLRHVHGHEDLARQVQNVLRRLYTPASRRPGTRSVTFILRAFDGVAYTTGSDLDDDHKEIHVSTDYIAGIARRPPRDEILGVVCHELVHCFQWSAEGTCPGGLIEGVADWVRLRAGLAATHWKQEADGRWDAGYQHTGFFLEYLEQRFGEGTVRKINEGLREGKYDEKTLFGGCCGGETVDRLWEDYRRALRERRPSDTDGLGQTVPTHTPSRPSGS